MSLQLFCPRCAAYLGPCARTCPNPECSFTRPDSECLPGPEQPYWTQRLPGAICGQPLFLENGEMLVAWGKPGGGFGAEPPGGLEWLDLRSGQPVGPGVTFDRPVVGQIRRIENLVVLALGGRHKLSNGAAAGIDLAQRRLTWGPVELSGALACGPDLSLPRAAFACSDGQVQRLRPLDGEGLAPVRFLTSEPGLTGPPALLASRERYFVPSRNYHGQVIAAEAGQSRPLARFEAMIDVLSRLKDGRLLVGLDDGRLFRIDPNVWDDPKEISRAGGGLKAPPLEQDGVLYFGASDHCLYAIDLDGTPLDWSPLSGLAGTPRCPPLLEHGLLFVGDSHGEVCAVDARTGKPAWRYHLEAGPDGPDQVASLSYAQGRLFVGARSGLLVCLPWHLGQYTLAAGRASPEQAGEFWSVAADFTPQPRRAAVLREQAARAWEENGQSEKAGAMWQADGKLELAAQAFEAAAEGRRLAQAEKAAGFYVQAHDLWNDLVWDGTPDGNREAERACDRILDRLRTIPGVYMPLLKARLLNAPKFIQRSDGRFTIEVKNTGAIAAFNIRLYCGGGLEDGIELPMEGQPAFEPHLPGQARQYKFVVRPSRKVPLRIDIHYQDYLQKFPPLQTTLLVPLEIDEALVFQTGDIGYLRLESVQNLVVQGKDIGAVNVKQGGINQLDAGGDIGLVNAVHVQPVCTVCGWTRLAGRAYCESCGSKFG